MRRQARVRAGGAPGPRAPRTPPTANALQVWLWLLLFIFKNDPLLSNPIKPGYLDFDNLPETNFTCEGKVIGGYYADLETSCQMFHVCTVGQHEEPMDIKFLCLNGTVFDQETRVCERVDEVDCTKSERFYSLNLELYGNTVPPIIQPSQKTDADEELDNKPVNKTKPNINKEESHFTNNNQKQVLTYLKETTQSAIHFTKKYESKPPIDDSTFADTAEEQHQDLEDDDVVDSENPDYDDYYNTFTTTSLSSAMTTESKKTFTTTTVPTIPTTDHQSYSNLQSATPFAIQTSTKVSQSSLILPTLSSSAVSPEEFINRHRGPGSEAISFQHYGFHHTDDVFITHPPLQEYDQSHYESSRTAPRPIASKPATFVNRPQPSPFKTTTFYTKDQLLRPGPTSQSSERYETSIKHDYLVSTQRPFDPFYFDHKRLNDYSVHTARSISSPKFNLTTRHTSKPKSPPRVIVTASASVSDSNGKRLNYTVGNVVNAVKPIVPINYDDYKESDLIFDPFFLDVPKLQNRRKSRSNKKETVLSPHYFVKDNFPLISDSTDTKTDNNNKTAINATNRDSSHTLNPNDYVDDNYEPLVYVAPQHPLEYSFSKNFKNREPEESDSKKEEPNKESVHVQSRRKSDIFFFSPSKEIKQMKLNKIHDFSSQNFDLAISPISSYSILMKPICTQTTSSYICKNRA